MRRDDIRVGVAGLAFGAAVHVPALRTIAGVDVVGLAGTDGARARAKAAELGIAEGVASIEALLDLKPDAVTLALPPRENEAACAAALARGIAVFSEKPLAYSVAAADELARRARGRVTAVDFEFAEVEGFVALRDALRTEQWGKSRVAQVTWLVESFAQREKRWSWKTDADRSAGVLSLLGSHVLHALEWLFGPICELRGAIRNDITQGFAPPGGRAAPELAQFSCRHANGVSVNALIGNAAPGGCGQRWEVVCDEATLLLSNPGPGFISGFELTACGRANTREVLLASKGAAVDEYIAPVAAIMRRFIAAVRGEAAAMPDFQAAARVQALMAALEESSREKRALTV